MQPLILELELTVMYGSLTKLIISIVGTVKVGNILEENYSEFPSIGQETVGESIVEALSILGMAKVG